MRPEAGRAMATERQQQQKGQVLTEAESVLWLALQVGARGAAVDIGVEAGPSLGLHRSCRPQRWLEAQP